MAKLKLTSKDFLTDNELTLLQPFNGMRFIAHNDFLRSNVGVVTTFYTRSLWASFILSYKVHLISKKLIWKKLQITLQLRRGGDLQMKVNRLLVLLAIVCFSFSMPSWASAQPTKIQWTSNFTEKVLYKSVVTSQDETLLATYDDSGADMIYQVFKINNTTKVKTPLGTLIGGDIILHEAAGHAFIIHLNTKVNEWKVYDEDLVEVYRNTFGSAELTVSLNYNYLIYDSSDKRIYFSFNTLKEVSVEDITVEDYKMTIDDGNTFVDTVAINNVALEHKVIIDFEDRKSVV